MITMCVQLAKRTGKWLPVIMWGAMIFYVSGQPKAAIPQLPPVENVQPHWIDAQLGKVGLDRDSFLKKSGHLFAFGIFGLLGMVATGSGWGGFWLATFYALTDEFHQSFVPTRGASPLDVLLDSAGAALFIGTAVWFTQNVDEAKLASTNLDATRL